MKESWWDRDVKARGQLERPPAGHAAVGLAAGGHCMGEDGSSHIYRVDDNTFRGRDRRMWVSSQPWLF